MRPVALAFLLGVTSCSGAARGYSAFIEVDGGADDGSGDDGADGGGGSSGDDGPVGPVGPPACVLSSCKSCVLGTASCSAAGACQCCVGAVCLP